MYWFSCQYTKSSTPLYIILNDSSLKLHTSISPIYPLRDCSLFIGSTGPVFCEKDPWKKFLSRQQKFPKKLVSRQWKEGKKSMSRIITLYSHCVRGVICNDQRSLPLTAGVWGCCKPPPSRSRAGPW